MLRSVSGLSACAALLMLTGCVTPGAVQPLPAAPSATPAASPGERQPETRAERTNYLETTTYEEVMTFLETVTDVSPDLHLTTFGYSYEGRPLPLVVWGAAGADPEAVAAAGKTRVFIQANIHAGEVEGKEAMLMLTRELAQGQHGAWADSLVLLIAPIYNADGNERVTLTNRPHQYGPLGGMGQRPNAQGYDLNRDHMKLDSPEAHALTGLLNRYDPHVAVDLHATNGTYHAYHLTFSPPLHPDTDAAIVEMMRGDWLPAVRQNIRERHGWEMYYYGNIPRGESTWAAPPGSEIGWYTFDYRPRFNTNYLGLRNRFAILSEAYAYLTFRERVEVTGAFVREILDYARANATPIREIVEAADRRSVVGRELSLRSSFSRSAEPVDILMGAVAEERNPFSGEIILRRLDTSRVERMHEFGTFHATETETAPAAYLIPAELGDVLAKLTAHGVQVTELSESREMAVERFRIASSERAPRPFQQHNELTLTGTYQADVLTIPAGTRVVRLDQPLGLLAFHLLEPRAADGFANWNVLDDALEGAEFYPVFRVRERF